jgi:hypothetical protein
MTPEEELREIVRIVGIDLRGVDHTAERLRVIRLIREKASSAGLSRAGLDRYAAQKNEIAQLKGTQGRLYGEVAERRAEIARLKGIVERLTEALRVSEWTEERSARAIGEARRRWEKGRRRHRQWKHNRRW